jgi:hypothetical protein
MRPTLILCLLVATSNFIVQENHQVAAAPVKCKLNIQSETSSTFKVQPEDPGVKNSTSSSDGDKDSGSKPNSGSGSGDIDVGGGSKSGEAVVTSPSPASVSPVPTSVAPSSSPSSEPLKTLAPVTAIDTNARFLQQVVVDNASEATMATILETGSETGSASIGDDSPDDYFTCDEAFYAQWSKYNLLCGGVGIDVSQAVQASSCVIYSGELTQSDLKTPSCMSICAFPTCVDDKWVYGGQNGMSSQVYQDIGVDAFMSGAMKDRLLERTQGTAKQFENSLINATKQCPYVNEASFSTCSCNELVNGKKVIKKKRDDQISKGNIPKDSTSNAGKVLAPTTKSVAGVTVAVTSIAAVASGIVGSTAASTAHFAAAGGSAAIVTIEICQFGVMINQLKLEGKSAVLAEFGKQMAPSAFAFLPFGKLENSNEPNSADFGGRRLLESSVPSKPEPGIAAYSRTLGIREDMLFLVTLAGIFVVMAGIVALFFFAYLVAGCFMSRADFLNNFFDKMIGLQVLIMILSQYVIGVTATFQIHLSIQNGNATSDPKCYLALASILFMAVGIMIFGFVIMKRYESDLQDMGTFSHTKKKVSKRYGPLYDEYKYKNRFFFAPKMMLALVSGIATGMTNLRAEWQVGVILGAHILFFFYLEIVSPHFSKFIQTTTSFMMIMKIAVLVLTFFLISTISQETGLPTDIQNGISLAIVGLNLFVLFLLMIRSLYLMWKKYQIERSGKFDEQDDVDTEEYFKDETPTQEKGPSRGKLNNFGNQQNPYMITGGELNREDDDIRLRGANLEHEGAPASMYSSRREAAKHYSSREYPQYSRNDVVEL